MSAAKMELLIAAATAKGFLGMAARGHPGSSEIIANLDRAIKNARISGAGEAARAINWDADELISPCGACGGKVAFDFTVSDAFWLRAVAGDLRLGVLCLPCLDNLCGGIPAEEVQVIYFTGKNGTIPFVPASKST